MVKIKKKIEKAFFDSSKEASWCTECNPKYPSSLQSTDSEKVWKNLQNDLIPTKNTNNGNFWSFFFKEIVLFKELGCFALRSVHQNASFEVSKTAFGQFFKIFTIRSKVKTSGKEKTGSKIKKKNYFGISMTIIAQKWVVEVGWKNFGLYGSPL